MLYAACMPVPWMLFSKYLPDWREAYHLDRYDRQIPLLA
jgi:hypothetical protein